MLENARCTLRCYVWAGLLSVGCYFVARAQEPTEALQPVEAEPSEKPLLKAEPVLDDLPVFREDGIVVSASKQFRVVGGDLASRGLAANLAEEAKDEFLHLLGKEKDAWKVEVKIDLRGKEGDKIGARDTAFDLWLSEKGYELKMFYHLSRGLRKDSFKRGIVIALIYERFLRVGEEIAADVRLKVPPWLVEGLEEATSWRLKKSDRRLYDALFRQGGIFRLDDLFAMDENAFDSLDAASRAAFRVSSGSLVMALLEQPEGVAGMKAFLAEVPLFDGEMPQLLSKNFPDMNLSETSMAKWMELQLANKGAAELTDVFDILETEKILKEALKLRYKDGEGNLKEVELGEWEVVAGLEKIERVEAVRMAQDDLLRLSYRCFPSYRKLLMEYQVILTDIVNGNTKLTLQTLEGLSETRKTMFEKGEMAKDFMNWFEITRARETSGEFEDYIKLKARLKQMPNQRKDGVTEYLDRLDPLFRVPEEKRNGFFAFE